MLINTNIIDLDIKIVRLWSYQPFQHKLCACPKSRSLCCRI